MVDRFIRGLTRALALGFIGAVLVAIGIGLWTRLRQALEVVDLVDDVVDWMRSGVPPPGPRSPRADLHEAHTAAGELAWARSHRADLLDGRRAERPVAYVGLRPVDQAR